MNQEDQVIANEVTVILEKDTMECPCCGEPILLSNYSNNINEEVRCSNKKCGFSKFFWDSYTDDNNQPIYFLDCKISDVTKHSLGKLL